MSAPIRHPERQKLKTEKKFEARDLLFRTFSKSKLFARKDSLSL